MKTKPEYLLTYQCKNCGEKSSFADLQKPHCRYCEKSTGMEIISKQKITPKIIEEQLKASMDRTFKSLQSAFESMTEEDKAAFGEGDAEKEMLLLLAKTKELKENIDRLELKENRVDTGSTSDTP